MDSFFLIGGTLTAYTVFKELEKAGSQVARWLVPSSPPDPRHVVTSVLYYVHRYLRLTIPYALIMGVIIAVLPHLTYGTFFALYAYTVEVSQEELGINAHISQECRNKGWQNLLYINTLVKEGTFCMGVTWWDSLYLNLVTFPGTSWTTWCSTSSPSPLCSTQCISCGRNW